MEKIIVIAVIILAAINLSVRAQKPSAAPDIIQPSRLAITFFKTTNLVFPHTIKSVDRGSKDVLVQKVKGVENILQVKAASRGFDQTNLTVITADGKLYSFLIDYADTPTVLNVSYAVKGYADAFISHAPLSEAQLQADVARVAAEGKVIKGLKDKSYGMALRLEGWRLHDEVMYCRLRLTNSSSISYRIDEFRFTIKDEKKSRRTASQELELVPIYTQGDTSIIAGKSEQVLVFALPKFTIPDRKYLSIQVMEEGGGRHLALRVHNKTVMKAKPL